MSNQESEVKAKGRYRQEGKTYVIQVRPCQAPRHPRTLPPLPRRDLCDGHCWSRRVDGRCEGGGGRSRAVEIIAALPGMRVCEARWGLEAWMRSDDGGSFWFAACTCLCRMEM